MDEAMFDGTLSNDDQLAADSGRDGGPSLAEE